MHTPQRSTFLFTKTTPVLLCHDELSHGLQHAPSSQVISLRFVPRSAHLVPFTDDLHSVPLFLFQGLLQVQVVSWIAWTIVKACQLTLYLLMQKNTPSVKQVRNIVRSFGRSFHSILQIMCQ